MRNILCTLYLVTLSLLTACTGHQSPISNVQLLERLQTLQQQGTMFGHQDDPFYGITWEYEPGRSDVLESCGDYPAVMGFDLGGIEMGDTKNLDSVPFDCIREEIRNHHRRGGIITISWHPRNPLTGGTAWDATPGVVTAILGEGEVHERFMLWLERVRTFLSSLTDDNGKPIPFIFRPWHENNGAWFWWGSKQCTPDEYRALYFLTQDQIINHHTASADRKKSQITNHKSQITNILWSYSPNLMGNMTEEIFFQWYPGDDRIDLIGLDAYQWGTEEDFVRQTNADLDMLCAFGAAHHKLVALTECGFKNIPDPTWWDRVLLPIVKAHPILYAHVWRNYVEEYFGPVPGTRDAEQFRIFYHDPATLFLQDIVPSPFVRQRAGQLWLENAPYQYIGTNFWYGAILASQGQGGNRQRLHRELDYLQSIGVTNLRILVGSDGERGVLTKVEPTLQTAPGVYNDTILDGLDYLLSEMAKRDMKAVLYLNNAWEWSGGYGFYLEHAGYGVAPRPEEAGYMAYMNHVAQFSDAPEAQSLFYDYVRFIVSRTNRYTNLPYTDDPTIMAWQIGNEPRAFGQTQKKGFVRWLSQASALIRSLDKQHLISIGSEGIWGCEMDSALYRTICADPNIDYLNAHIWPYNWGWVHPESLAADLPTAIRNTADYLRPHLHIAQDLTKPLVIEEFGFPRDEMSCTPGSATTARDTYYHYIFSQVKTEPLIAGCNFWGWGGYAQPNHNQWQVGDDYTGDPAQEPQGLNSVFVSDKTTLAVIRQGGTYRVKVTDIPVEQNRVFEECPSFTVILENTGAEKTEAEVELRIDTDTKEYVTTLSRRAKIAANASQPVALQAKKPLSPGFYRATCIVNGEIVQSFVFAVQPTRIVSAPDKQPDFDAFWVAAKQQLETIPMNATLTEIPSHSTTNRKVWLVEMQSVPDGLTGEPVIIRGYYAEPRDGKKHPVLIHYQGYDSGYRPGTDGNVPWCLHGDGEPRYAEFILSTRGQAVNNRPAQDRDDGIRRDFTNTYGDWFAFHFGDKDSYYYRGAFMDCVQAIRFMATRETSDMHNLFAEGQSQGGAFTYAAAALSDYPFRAIAPGIAFLGDYPDYFRTAHWPACVAREQQANLGITDEDLFVFLSYFDTKNLATSIACPTLACIGLMDDVCPPHTNVAPFNNLASTEKQLIVNPELGHKAAEDWYTVFMRFFATHIED